MFAKERRELILGVLRDKKRVEVKELEEKFQVSGATLRTDLRELEKQGKLVRTHGGALFREEQVQKEDLITNRASSRQKQMIAKEARKYIEEYDTVILDSGSTTLELAKQLKDAKNIKVITNDLRIALELQDNLQIDLYLVGGRVRNRFYLTHGAIGIDFLKSIAAGKVFLSPNALSVFDEATTSNEEMRAVKQAMLHAAGKAYMLCDSSKIGKRSFCKFASVTDFELMFTDHEISKIDREAIEKKGLKIKICE